MLNYLHLQLNCPTEPQPYHFATTPEMAKEHNGSIDLEVARTATTGTTTSAVGQHPFGEDKAIHLSPGVGHGLGSPVRDFVKTSTSADLTRRLWLSVPLPPLLRHCQ